jgi:uncharacterized membrane protein
MPACGAVFVIFAVSFGKIPVDEHSAINFRFMLVVGVTPFALAKDQYVAGANVSMKNASAISGFVSYDISQVR